MSAETLRFGWWNMGLVSPRKRADQVAHETAGDVVRALSGDHGLDLIVLCEVDAAAVGRMHASLPKNTWGVLVEEGAAGRARFDVGLLWRRDTCEVDLVGRVVHPHQESGRVAVHALCRVGKARWPLHLYVVHWPSQSSGEHGADERERLATRLYDEVQRLRQVEGAEVPVVIVGDFNDDPCARALTVHLRASRDREKVRKNSSLFYNPCWRILGTGASCAQNAHLTHVAGTYLWRTSPRETRWFTFDQIVVSASLLAPPWGLAEDDLKVVAPLEMLKGGSKLADDFDHLPLIATVTREL